MAEKKLKTRIILKHETTENWAKAVNFVPKEGEIVIYDNEKIKIGDGVKNVNDLDFVNEAMTDAEIDEICGANIYAAREVRV